MFHSPMAPDAHDSMDRTIEFGYDVMIGGTVAWKIERISRFEERRTRICCLRDGEHDSETEKDIKTLESWGVYVRQVPRIGFWENTIGGGWWRLHDTPMVRQVLQRINKHDEQLSDMLTDAFDVVFKAGYRPHVLIADAVGDVRWTPVTSKNVCARNDNGR